MNKQHPRVPPKRTVDLLRCLFARCRLVLRRNTGPAEHGKNAKLIKSVAVYSRRLSFIRTK